MGYVDDDSIVRVDFFRPSGKWYCTEGVKWITYHDWSIGGGGKLIMDAFEEALHAHLQGRLKGMWAVCLDPYHQNPFPLMTRVPNG